MRQYLYIHDRYYVFLISTNQTTYLYAKLSEHSARWCWRY